MYRAAALTLVAAFIAAPAAAQNGRTISGTVNAPAGQSLNGAVAIACLTPRATCAREATAPLTVSGGVGRYALNVPVDGDYHVFIWKDVNGNGAPDIGDIMAFANNMDAVPSGRQLTPMTAFVRRTEAMTTNTGGVPMEAPATVAAAGASGSAGAFAGRWTQRSSGTELVWGPEIKFQPSSATTGIGTNLGGTFGAGSATNTTITYSYRPMRMARSMTLEVQPDGAFDWSITTDRGEGACRPTRQRKSGRLSLQGDQATFNITDGSQNCGDQAWSSMPATTETYTLQRTSRGLRVTGTGGIDWTFTR